MAVGTAGEPDGDDFTRGSGPERIAIVRTYRSTGAASTNSPENADGIALDRDDTMVLRADFPS
jgi:hypothetical protein